MWTSGSGGLEEEADGTGWGVDEWIVQKEEEVDGTGTGIRLGISTVGKVSFGIGNKLEKTNYCV